VKAIGLSKDLPAHPIILDVGCGTGAQTIQLAHHIGGSIFALDNHKPYLDILRQKADKLGFGDCIQTIHGDMHNLPFTTGYFDLIWSEGAIYTMGFKEGLNYLKKFLKPSGYLAVSEISWLSDSLPSDLLAFWKQEYAAITPIKTTLKTIKEAGYEMIDYFILPESDWWDDFYRPLEKNILLLRKKYHENEHILEMIEYLQLEIDLYRKYPDLYGYVFYVLKRL
jgi:ubiquinone/menaquinone biosynthesis C-methylase UbiE